MISAKIGDIISDGHDSFVIKVLENGSSYIYKNANYIESLEIDDCPIEIQDTLKLEINRLKENLNADLQNKNISSKK